MHGKSNVLKNVVVNMMEDPVQAVDAGRYSPLMRGTGNGLEEQMVLLSELSKRLDEYFETRNFTR
jgi:hypothetical protein